jgi:hypothetical protein
MRPKMNFRDNPCADDLGLIDSKIKAKVARWAESVEIIGAMYQHGARLGQQMCTGGCQALQSVDLYPGTTHQYCRFSMGPMRMTGQSGAHFGGQVMGHL